MKKILTIVITSFMMLSMAAAVQAQEQTSVRKTRKEIRKQERAVKDSLMRLMKGSDSLNVGYGHISKDKNASSVSRLEKKSNMASYSNIGEYIKGKVPGVMVYQDGDSFRYNIRGAGSVNGPTDPLLLVDGIEVDNFDTILPSQVESVDVIKDASAAIYGMKGAAGVIMITTKKFDE